MPQAIRQYRVSAATAASIVMKGLTAGLPALLCALLVLDGDGVDEDCRGPGSIIYQMLASTQPLLLEAQRKTKKTYTLDIMHNPILCNNIWPYDLDTIHKVIGTVLLNHYFISSGRIIRDLEIKTRSVPREAQYYVLAERSICEIVADGGHGSVV